MDDKKIDWSSLDWKKPNNKLAEELNAKAMITESHADDEIEGTYEPLSRKENMKIFFTTITVILSWAGTLGALLLTSIVTISTGFSLMHSKPAGTLFGMVCLLAGGYIFGAAFAILIRKK